MLAKKSMLVKNFMYVGEAVCWWRQKLICMLVKYVGEKFSVCWWKELYVSEKFEQKIKCMLVKYVGEKFYVCWWEVRSRKNISFHQHAFFTNILHQHKNSHFSPTSFTNIRTAIKITYITYELHQKIHQILFFHKNRRSIRSLGYK